MAALGGVGVETTRESVKFRGNVGPVTVETNLPWRGAPHLDKDHRFALCIATDDYDDDASSRWRLPPPTCRAW